MMKKTSIKSIFKKDKSPKTPTEEAWGELFTTNSPHQQLTPSSNSVNLTPKRSPKRSLKQQPYTPPHSLDGKEYGGNSKLDRSSSTRGGTRCESKSSVERLSSLPRFSSSNNSPHSSFQHNTPSHHKVSTHITQRSMSANNNGRRFPLKNYVSASAVDLDDPIEAYGGPIDCDEVSLSSSSEHSGQETHDVSVKDRGTISNADVVTDNVTERNSPDTIPVVYEDCYDSDSWSSDLPSNLLGDASGKHPLTMQYTNDETIDVPQEDDTVYSFKARSEEESIIAPMSMDEIEDKDRGFGRMETDESAMDDEDYYRQDYFHMTKSTRIFHHVSEDDDVELQKKEHNSSLVEKVLEDSSDISRKQFSSQELTGMTEPDLPVSLKQDANDYGDLYTDTSFPFSDEEEFECSNAKNTFFENKNDITFEDESGEGDSNTIKNEEQTTALAVRRGKLEQSLPIDLRPMLPEDSEFVDEIKDSDVIINNADGNPLSVHDAGEEEIDGSNPDNICNKGEYEVIEQAPLVVNNDVVKDLDNQTEEGIIESHAIIFQKNKCVVEKQTIKNEMLINSTSDESNDLCECKDTNERLREGREGDNAVSDKEPDDSDNARSDETKELSGRCRPSIDDTLTADSIEHLKEEITNEPLKSKRIEDSNYKQNKSAHTSISYHDSPQQSDDVLATTSVNMQPGLDHTFENDETLQNDIQQIHYSCSHSLSLSPCAKQVGNFGRTSTMEKTTGFSARRHSFPETIRQNSFLTKCGSFTIESRSEYLNAYTSDKHDNILLPLTPTEKNYQHIINAQFSPDNRQKQAKLSSSEVSIDVNKLLQENQRLRVKHQQLSESLGSMTQQCIVHEKVSSEKIFSLEQKVRALVAEKANSIAADKVGCYDAETVHALSIGVVEQDKLLEMKEQQISKLKLQLEVFKQTMNEKEDRYHVSRKHWEEERLKLKNCLTSDEKKSMFTLQEELFESRANLNNALSDIDALTAALESNNDALDTCVDEVMDLRAFKAKHGNGEEVKTSIISRTAMPVLSCLPSRVYRQNSEVTELQDEVRELVVTIGGKSYHDLELEVISLQNELIAARLDATMAKKRSEQLATEVEGKTNELMKLREGIKASDNGDDNVANPSPGAEYWSKDLRDFSIVADLENKIAGLEKKLAELQDPAPFMNESNSEGLKDEFTNIDDPALLLTPCKARNEVGGTKSPSKEEPPESPLTARKLFQPLRRGWATASPLIKNNLLIDSSATHDYSSNEKDISKLNAIIKANTEVVDKLKRDIIKIQSEREDIESEMKSEINQLKEENAAYASQVDVLEKAFKEMNEKRVSDGDEMICEGSTPAPVEPYVSPNFSSQEMDLQSKNITLQRSITELENIQSHQDYEIKKLKSELIKVRVTSQQENDAALDQLRDEIAIVTAQKTALENQLIQINQSAGLLRDSLSDQACTSPNKKTIESNSYELTTPKSADDGVIVPDPILVAQVVMLENANKVLEKSVNSLRTDLQEKLSPLLEKVALLEEEKRVIEDEMNVKLQCRERTIQNLENSLQQLNTTRFGSGKKKRNMIADSRIEYPN